MIRQKSILFQQMNKINILFAFLFKLTGNKIYFLKASKSLANKEGLDKLDSWGIKWINYQDYHLDNPFYYWEIAKDSIENVGKSLREDPTYGFLKRLLNLSSDFDIFLQRIIEKTLQNKILGISELLMYCTYLSEKKRLKVRLFISNDYITRIVLNRYSKWPNFYPTWLTSFRDILIVFRLVKDSLLWRIKRFYKFVLNIFFNKYKGLSTVLDRNERKYDFSTFEVIYFPHKGIHYGNLYKKDHFYSSNDNNPFYPSKILHFSLSEDPLLIKRSIEYYQRNNIPYYDWSDISINIFSPPGRLRLLFKWLSISKGCCDMSLFLRYINLYYSVERNICKLNKMPHLKIVLVGFDYLFSEILILACKIKNIETIAVQERMLLLWLTGTKILFDHYFIIGSPVKKLIVEQQNGVKQSLYEIGPIRMTQHYDAQNTINDVLKKEVLDFKWCVLSLDYNSTPDYYANGIRHISNWKSNLSFYTTIFNLSKEFNEAKFFIKGKNNDFINIPFFKEIIDEINKRINCEIVNDFDLWTPFTAVSICDITIARHTSLGDEILALGKPVIFYDCYGFPSKVMDYGPRVISYSYDDLEKKLRDFFSDSTSYNNKLNSVRRKFYTVPKIPVKQVLDKKLEEIYTLSCNR